MKLIEFEEQTVITAKDQPEYNPFPAHYHGDAEGKITCVWRLTLTEPKKAFYRWIKVRAAGMRLGDFNPNPQGTPSQYRSVEWAKWWQQERKTK